MENLDMEGRQSKMFPLCAVRPT